MSLPTPYYERAGITLYCGDALDLMPKLAAEGIRPGITATDPPYGVGYAEWDHGIPPLLWLEIARAISEVVAFTPGNGRQHLYPPPIWTLAWARPGSIQVAASGKLSNWEPILVYGKRNTFTVDLKTLPGNTGAAHFDHPCPKPLALMAWIVNESKTSGLVLDPFAGSGTTLRAAKDLGRPAIGIEISEDYCKVAVSRLGQEVLPFTP